MKKILLALLLVLTLGFTLLMTNSVSADEDLIDLYPQNNPDFAETYGNSHWTVDFNGHRWHMVKRSTRHVSNFTGFDPDAAAGTVQEFVGSDVPAVFYPSGSGSLIINDTEFDALVTSPGQTRLEITATVNNRFWAYFDENGKLYMYEDEFVNPEYITKVEGEDYWRLSTEAEITQFNDAEEGEKPENIRHTPIRIKTTEDGYKAEPLALTWATSHNPADPQESVIVDHESSAVLIPAGHTVVSFGEMARNAPVLEWTGGFPELIAEGYEGTMSFQYHDTDPYFAGVTALDQNPNSEFVTVIVGYNAATSHAQLIAGVSARYIDEEDDIAGKGDRLIFKHTDFNIEIFDGETSLQSIDYTYDETEEEYVPSGELTAIDTSLFGKEYRLVYSAVSPMGEELTVEETVVVSVGVLPPTISGLETKYVPIGGYLNLYEGLTAHDIENNVDITDSIRITHSEEFNPNFVPFGTHEITVEASWIYAQDFGMTIEWGEGETAVQWVFDDLGNNINFAAPGTASRINTIYTIDAIDTLTTAAFKAQAEAWGRVTMVIDKATGKTLTRLDRFANTTPEILDENGDVVIMSAEDYDFNAWITEYLTEDTVLLHTHGSDDAVGEKSNRVRSNVLTLGTELNIVSLTEFISEKVVTTNTFNVIGQDAVAPTVTVSQPTYTIYNDAGFTSVAQALAPNVTATDNDKINNLVFTGVTLQQLTTAGEYTATVIAADRTGNTTQAQFTLRVLERESDSALVDEIDDLNDQLTEANNKFAELETELESANGKVAELEGQIADLEVALEEKPEGTSIVVVIIISVVSAGLAFGGAFLLGKKG